MYTVQRYCAAGLAALAMALGACSTDDDKQATAPSQPVATANVDPAPVATQPETITNVFRRLTASGYEVGQVTSRDTTGSTFIATAKNTTVNGKPVVVYTFDRQSLRDGWLDMALAMNSVEVVGSGYALDCTDVGPNKEGAIAFAHQLATALGATVRS